MSGISHMLLEVSSSPFGSLVPMEVNRNLMMLPPM